MTTPLLATKLHKPASRPQLVMRSRLLEQLNAGLHRKLTLISAPAGFGKTTFAVSWLKQLMIGESSTPTETDVAWLSLDEDDSDPVRFLRYLVAALQTIAPEVGNQLLIGLQSPQPPSPAALLTNLLNELAQLPSKAVLVLDDFHRVDSAEVEQAVAFLVEHLPPQLHLVITTRQDPALSLPRLRARDELTELRAADLRFSVAETAVFLNTIMGLTLTADEIVALEARTEGWIAGLQLAAVSLRGQPNVQSFIEAFTGNHRFVLDYLLEEVLNQQPPAVQNFLLKTAVLERFCADLCEAVAQDETLSGTMMLNNLEQSNLFLIPLDHERRWYRFHHLFADLLRQRLHQANPADGGTVAMLHRRASHWFVQNGLELEAFHHATQANDLAQVIQIIEGAGMPLQFRGGAVPILNWLKTLPHPLLDANPVLWVTYGSAILMLGKIEGVAEKVAAAEAALQKRPLNNKNRDLLGRIASSRATLAVTQHQPKQIVAQAEKALSLLHPDNVPVRASVTWMLAYAHELQKERTAAKQAYETAVKLCEAVGHSMIAMMARMGVASIQEKENQLTRAADTYRQLLQPFGESPPPPACEAFLGLVRIHYEQNELKEALAFAKKSAALAEQIAQTDRLLASQLWLARLRLLLGDEAGAEKLQTVVFQPGTQSTFALNTPEIISLQVRLLLAQGEVHSAKQLVGQHHLPQSRARVLLARQDAATALPLLLHWQQRAGENGWLDEQLQSRVLLAVAQQQLGEATKAQIHLEEALRLAAAEGFVRTFLDVGASLLPVLEKTAVYPAYVQKLKDAFAAEKAASLPTPSASPLIEPLSRRELEILQLIAEGLSNREIGERLFLALSTVKGHNRILFDKLHVRRRTEAVARARALGLL